MKTHFKNIMLIDDTETDIYISKCMIEAYHLAEHVIPQSSGAGALNYLRAHRHNPQYLPELILLDIRMPVMDGFDFLDEYNKLPSVIHNTCLIALLSSSLDFEDLSRAKCNPHVINFLCKPLLPEMLMKLNNEVSKRVRSAKDLDMGNRTAA